MKKLLLLCVIFSVIINIFAQENGNDLQTIATLRSNGRIALVKSEYQIPADQFFEKYHTYFGLGTAGEMVLKAVEPLHNGSQAFRYQQYTTMPRTERRDEQHHRRTLEQGLPKDHLPRNHHSYNRPYRR